MKLKSVLVLSAICLMGICAGGAVIRLRGSAATAASPERVPAQQLPQMAAVPVAPFEVTWAKGVLEGASMYFPAELEVLEVIHSEPTKRLAIGLMGRLDSPLSSEQLARLPEQPLIEGDYQCGSGSFRADIFSDGNLGLVWGDRGTPAERSTGADAGLAPRTTVEEAVAIADGFVKQAGLLPEGARLTDVTPRDAISRHNDATGKEESAALDCSVVYRRFHDGIPEGRVGVWVTGKGEVFSFSRNMRDVRSLGRYPILRPDEARKAIWSPDARVMAGSNSPEYMPVEAAIEKVQMEYYDGATAWRYDTIQPIYIFTGTGWDSKGRPQSFSAMVPAVRPEYVEPAELPRAGGAAGPAEAGVP
jgi:hypothetical protein